MIYKTGSDQIDLTTGGSVTRTAVIYSNGSQECERIAQLLKALPEVSEFHLYTVGEEFEQYHFQHRYKESKNIA